VFTPRRSARRERRERQADSHKQNGNKEAIMKVQSRLALSLAQLLSSAAGTWATISTDYDHSVEFGHDKTFSWGAVKTQNSLWDERVKAAVNSDLAAKGWTLVPSGGDVNAGAGVA
jgi:hypothetical protein